jgi:hypothetical protein
MSDSIDREDALEAWISDWISHRQHKQLVLNEAKLNSADQQLIMDFLAAQCATEIMTFGDAEFKFEKPYCVVDFWSLKPRKS